MGRFSRKESKDASKEEEGQSRAETNFNFNQEKENNAAMYISERRKK